jgi:PIN domain-containing protein
MRDAYRGYLQFSAEDLDLLWKDALIVPDSNILLNLYRYSETTRSELLKLLVSLRERLWLPNQAGLEFYRNRLTVIFKEASKYQVMLESFSHLLEDLDRTRGHPFVSPELRRDLSSVQERLKGEVAQNVRDLEKLQGTDPILDQLDGLFSGRVGERLSNDEVAGIPKEGEDRYKRRIPPGFQDEKKPDETKYGDLVLWKQVLKKARSEKRSVILVSDDRKEDWWWG